MTRDDMAKHMDKVFADCNSFRNAGQAEYAQDDNEAFANFIRVGLSTKIPKDKVLWVYLEKHLDGIKSYLNGHRSQRESVHGRIKDAIVYLVLLDGMVWEDEIALLDKSKPLTDVNVALTRSKTPVKGQQKSSA